MQVSAYIPCFNNADTVRTAVESLRAQTITPAEIVVIDDGSTDGSAEVLGRTGARVIRHVKNLGRGAARARAMQETRHELVLCCDAGNVLDPAFTERALPWFDDPRVAAVHGLITQRSDQTAAERWRRRHLFKTGHAANRTVRHHASFFTTGALVRRSALAAAGGYDASLRHSEDQELGRRLLARGCDVVFDPQLLIVSIRRNTVRQVLERYWRWHAGPGETVSWGGYWKNTAYALKVMAAADVRERDWTAAAISLLCPHFQFWYGAGRKLRGRGTERTLNLTADNADKRR